MIHSYNPKKYREDRRKRPGKNVATHQMVYIEKHRLSAGMVKYTRYLGLVMPK